jgi:hypothetical protein
MQQYDDLQKRHERREGCREGKRITYTAKLRSLVTFLSFQEVSKIGAYYLITA